MEAMAPRAAPLDVEHLLAQAGWTRGLAQRLVRDADLAEDLLQDTWIAALERPPAEGSLRGWLAVVMRNLALRRQRRDAARNEAERGAARRESVRGPVDSPEETVERMQLQRMLAEAILALDEPFRSAVILRHLDGLSAAEIGARQGCSPDAARQRVSRGLAALRAELDRRTAGGRAAWCVALAGTLKLARAKALPLAAAPATLWIGGVWMGAKLAATAAGLGLAAGAWFWIQRESAPSSAPAALPSEVLAAIEAPGMPPPPPLVAAAEPQAAPIPAAGSARVRIDAPAPHRTALRGRVLDQRGTALVGAKVALSPWNPFQMETPAVAETQSDSTGAFALGLDREQSEALESNGHGFVVSAELAGYVPASTVVGTTGELELVLVERPLVRGRLLDPSGAPARPPGRVSLTVVDAAGRAHPSSVDIDASGAFESSELVPGKLTSAEGRARGFAFAKLEPELDLAAGARHELDLTLAPGSVVRGIVVDEESKAPIPFAEVWAQSWSYQPDSIEPSTVADAGGRFELRGVDLEQMQGDGLAAKLSWLFISARAPGYAGKPFDAKLVQHRSEGEHFVTVEIPRAGAVVSIRVRWADGSPAAGMLATALDSQSNLLWKVTDGEGRFELTGLPAGRVAVHVRTRSEDGGPRAGVAQDSIEVAQGQSAELALTLSEGRGTIRGRVRDASGAPLAGITVEAGEHFHAGNMTVGIGSHRTATDAEGCYELKDLLASRYQVEIGGAPLNGRLARPSSLTIELGAGEQRDSADFEVVDAVEVSGWVDPGSLSLAELEVVALAASDGAERGRAAPQPDGSYSIGGLLPEPHHVALLHQGKELVRTAVGSLGATGVRLVAPR